MKFYLETKECGNRDIERDTIIKFSNGKIVYAELKDMNYSVDLGNGKHVYIYGDIFYHLRSDGEIKLIDSGSEEYLKRVFLECSLKDVIANLEGQYIGLYVDATRNLVHIFNDRYARIDSFYAYVDSKFFFSSDLDAIFRNIKPEYDQKMLAHFFSVYGWYTPKGFTIYKNVKQPLVGEIITLSGSGIHSEMTEFKPLKIEDYADKDLEVYYKILRESVIARANREGKTWVSSSSGWDSSLILGLLVDEFGKQNVGMLTGSLDFSKKTEAFNRFEISKTNKIGSYYGIRPEIVKYDFKSKTAPDYWTKVLPYYKSRHIYGYNSYNTSKMSSALSTFGKGLVIFNGETADSFHNFGFSQFATFFHEKKFFTEYADKMNCYLYGPSFFKKVMDGSYKRDKVFQIFMKMKEGVGFNLDFEGKEDVIESYLYPFFYGSPRIPFANTYTNPALNEKGQKAIYNFLIRDYMPQLIPDFTEENMYSWLIYLYHSLHSQGATVRAKSHAMEHNNHRCRSPYFDIRLVNFLSKMPEEWGRGLEFNNTKYPLKWVAKNKIKFPYDLLDKGPHAYLWDIKEGFSLMTEITYRSGVTGMFKDVLTKKSYKDILDDEYFEMKYLDNLVLGYLNGEEVSGKDLNNLISLITLCITGWY